MATSEEYKRQALKLLPQGLIWFFDDDKNVAKLINALADEMEVVDGAAEAFLNDFFPDTTSQFLPDWERVAGLPDPCSGLAATIGLRRQDLLTKLTSIGGQNRQYFIDLAASLGYTITITEFNPFRTGISRTGDALNGVDWQHAWQVNGVENEIQYFRVGVSATGDALRSWGQTRLECLLNRLKPAHTILLFEYA